MVEPVDDEGHLSVESAVEGRTARLTLAGELDLSGVDAIAEKLDEFAEGDLDAVVIDASGLTFLDSSGLRALLSGREQLREKGIELRVADASAAVTRVLDMTGTRTLLEG
jgi:stage II sporulation protein AA (anti-sigma F factor antagonist)